MKVFKYTPRLKRKDSKGKDNPVFKGCVEIEVGNRKERIELSKSLLYKVDGDGKVIEKPADQGLDDALYHTDLVKKHVKSVDLVHVESGEKITDFEELEYYQEGDAVISELINVVYNGVQLGNS